jgi:16S rRNA (adenine1518-N6/adenine1519-N6)-dimethyltransferase
MNILTDPEHLKNLFRSLNLKPKDYMGQNFLISEDVLAEIISLAEIKRGETVVEIGPGLGVLTQQLVEKTDKVIAIEKDRLLFEHLKNFFQDSLPSQEAVTEVMKSSDKAIVEKIATRRTDRNATGARDGKKANVFLINQDVLKFNFEGINGDYKIVANIPYYLTSHLLQMLLTLKHKPSKIIFMVQKEVGERLTASAGGLSILGISVQIFADVEMPVVVPKNNFWPVPKVDSAVVVISPRVKFPEIDDEKLFFRLLKIAFAGKRKQIHNSLVNGLKWDKNKVEELLTESRINSAMRPQELTLEQWIRLFQALKARQV